MQELPEWKIIDRIKCYPRIGLSRQLARKLLKEVGSEEIPISLGKVIKYLHTKNNLSVEPVFDFGEKISGILVVFEDSSTIGFNKKQHWYRRRFTISHEIGHLLMNTTCDSIDEALNSSKSNEITANEFAAELLIPLKKLKNDFKNGIQNIDILSDRYKVSKEAIGWKIIHSGLLTK